MKIATLLRRIGVVILLLTLSDGLLMFLVEEFSLTTRQEQAIQLVLMVLELVALYFLRATTIERVLKPLGRITEILPKAAAGDLSVRLPMDADDEFGEVAHIFNELAAKQQQSTTALDLKVKAKTAELRVKVKELERIQSTLEVEKSRIEQLAKDNERFKLAVDGASDHVVISDSQGKVLYANQAAEKMTGYSFDEMRGKSSGKLWGGLMSKEYYKDMWHTIEDEKKSFVGVLKNKRKNGVIYDVAISISPILDKKGDPIFYVALERDITKEVAIDKAKTEFVSLASHQLRTPLTAINWYTEMLMSEESGNLSDKQKDYLNEIAHGNQRMVDLVNNLLNASRLELGTFAVNPELLDVCEVVRDVTKEIEPSAKTKGVNLSSSCGTGIPKIMLDAHLMHFVVQNLVSNAIKYTPTNGEVKINLAAKDDCLFLTVADTGLGIPLSQQPSIFTKFFRADNVREKDTDGTGLGLYIAKSVIDAAKGKIWFESVENKGTTFYATIPFEGMEKHAPTK